MSPSTKQSQVFENAVNALKVLAKEERDFMGGTPGYIPGVSCVVALSKVITLNREVLEETNRLARVMREAEGTNARN